MVEASQKLKDLNPATSESARGGTDDNVSTSASGDSLVQMPNHAALAATIQQVTLSTTVVTNAIVSGHIDSVDLYVVPGPGMNISHTFPVEPIIVKGYTDHRGMVQERIGAEAFKDLVDTKQENKRAAISAKFSVRNPKEELRLASLLREDYDFVSAGSLLSGSLNFPRRTVSAYYNSAVASTFANFKEQVTRALDERGIIAPVYILKADGGSLPLDKLVQSPVETAFTGPAASVLGLQALQTLRAKHGHMAVAIDIGGTTTDISLWENGQPLMTKEGVAIEGYPSSIRSFLVRSIGVAGETAVRVVDGQLQVGPDRVGPSVALGGSVPTLGDALVYLGHASYGDKNLAQEAMETLLKQYRETLPARKQGDQEKLAYDLQEASKEIKEIHSHS
ncbi:MAG: hydantoinase/oxoprolinase, partial [Veillonella sp.]|nr:hydantoinase/oxoprolinase [Veillonella sp.]